MDARNVQILKVVSSVNKIIICKLMLINVTLLVGSINILTELTKNAKNANLVNILIKLY
jgi:hypothetical protein